MNEINTLVLVGIPALIAVVTVLIYNTIVRRYNAVDRAWASVLSQERQKNKILPHVEAMVEQYKLHEGSVLTEVTKLRSALSTLSDDAVDTTKLTQTKRHTEGLLQGLKVAVEAYPELKASDTYLKVMAEISEQQQQVGAALRIFNHNVEAFNNTIQMFPGALVNNMLNRKQSVDSFTDKQAQAGFDYKPKL